MTRDNLEKLEKGLWIMYEYIPKRKGKFKIKKIKGL